VGPHRERVSRAFDVTLAPDLVEDAPDLIYRVTRRVIDVYRSNLANFSTGPALESETLLSIAITLQRLEEPHKTHGLELFELLLKYNAYKVREVLMDIDRRPSTSTSIYAVRRRRRPRRPRGPEGLVSLVSSGAHLKRR
jgi:hypothetical protein